MTRLKILRYYGGSDREVAEFILDIQRSDVGLVVPIGEQPDLLDIGRAYRDGAFWLARADDTIVGTVGMARYGKIAVLKKLFVSTRHRGPGGAALPLLEACLQWAREHGLNEVVLDTPAIARRSHAFYRRQGFELADRSVLPPGYTFPDRESLVFRLEIQRPGG